LQIEALNQRSSSSRSLEEALANLPDIAFCILRYVEAMFTVLVDYDRREKLNSLGLHFIPKTG